MECVQQSGVAEMVCHPTQMKMHRGTYHPFGIVRLAGSENGQESMLVVGQRSHLQFCCQVGLAREMVVQAASAGFGVALNRRHGGSRVPLGVEQPQCCVQKRGSPVAVDLRGHTHDARTREIL